MYRGIYIREITVAEIKFVKIRGVLCVPRLQFARIASITDGALDKLIRRGNRVRKLKTMKKESHVFIPASEITEFVFVRCPGPGDKFFKLRLSADRKKYERYNVRPVISRFEEVKS